MGGDGFRANAWEFTPWWHWRYWRGHRMRRWTYDDWSLGGMYDGQWEYATYLECATIVLEQNYGN